MLMVTTTVGMFNGVHCHTSDLWPAVSLHAVLVVRAPSFEHGLIDPTASSNNTDDGSVFGWVELFDTRRELDSGSPSVEVVRYDGAVAARGLGNLTAVSSLLLHGADDGSFWHGSNRQNITNGQGSLLTAVDKLSGSNSLGADNGLNTLAVLVWIVELNLGEGSTTAWIVDNVLDETLDEPVSLGVVERAELGSTLSFGIDRCKDRAGTFSLPANDTSHVFYL